MEEGIRIDKWLWAVRIFKTRSLATDACRAGRVKVDDQVVKPSRELHDGQVIQISLPPIRKTVKVLGLIEKRVGSRLVPEFMEDLTPPEEYQKLHVNRETGFEYRQAGTGRPTKKSRREIDILKKFLGQ